MTKSKGIGRGGHRPGAGRKPNPKPPPLRIEVPADVDTADVAALAREHTGLAIAVLAAIAECGEKEASRVAAANALLDRAHGKPGGVASGAPDGKKAQRQASAHEAASAGGKFAPPRAPKLAVDNTR